MQANNHKDTHKLYKRSRIIGRIFNTLDGHIVHHGGRVAKMNAYTMLHIKIHYGRKQRAKNANNNGAI